MKVLSSIGVVAVVLGWISMLESSHAAPFRLGLEPIIGYEQVQVFLPTASTAQRLVYGGRLTLGVPLLALEAEYTRSSSSKTVGSDSYSDLADRAKVGLRSSIRLFRAFYFTLRGGAQAELRKYTSTVSGVTSTNNGALTFLPYAGAGFKIALAPRIAFTVEAVGIFRAFPDFSQIDLQTVAGLNIAFP